MVSLARRQRAEQRRLEAMRLRPDGEPEEDLNIDLADVEVDDEDDGEALEVTVSRLSSGSLPDADDDRKNADGSYKDEAVLEVVECLASGLNYRETARQTRVNVRTIERWGRDPEFKLMVAQQRELLFDMQEPLLNATIAQAQVVVYEALHGRRTADSSVVALAERLLSRTIHRSVGLQGNLAGASGPARPSGPKEVEADS